MYLSGLGKLVFPLEQDKYCSVRLVTGQVVPPGYRTGCFPLGTGQAVSPWVQDRLGPPGQDRLCLPRNRLSSLGTGQVGRAWGQLEYGERTPGMVARTVAARLKKIQSCF